MKINFKLLLVSSICLIGLSACGGDSSYSLAVYDDSSTLSSSASSIAQNTTSSGYSTSIISSSSSSTSSSSITSVSTSSESLESLSSIATSVEASEQESSYIEASSLTSTANIKDSMLDLCANYAPEAFEYKIECVNNAKNITLVDTGTICPWNDYYSYTYSTQKLNQIGSGADSLISTETGKVVGPLNLICQNVNEKEGVSVFDANLSDLINTNTTSISQNDNKYVMKGNMYSYKLNLSNLNGKVDFTLITNLQCTYIDSLSIHYATDCFNSVNILINYD